MARDVAEGLDEENPDHDAIFGRIEDTLLDARTHSKANMVTIGSEEEAEVFANIQNKEKTNLLQTGIGPIDERAGGVARTNVFLIAANTGGGKSVCGGQIALNAMKNKLSVCWVSLEMDDEECWERIWANVADVEHHKIKNGITTAEEDDLVAKARRRIERWCKKHKIRFSTYHPGYADPWDLYYQLKPYNFDVVIIDYVGLLRPPKGVEAKERIQLGASVQALKIIAGRSYLNCVMYVLAQLNEEDDVKYSKAMKEHSNFVLQWRRDERAKETHRILARLTKGRNSPLFSFWWKEEFPYMRLTADGVAGEKEVKEALKGRGGKGKRGSDEGIPKDTSDKAAKDRGRDSARSRRKKKQRPLAMGELTIF